MARTYGELDVGEALPELSIFVAYDTDTRDPCFGILDISFLVSCLVRHGGRGPALSTNDALKKHPEILLLARKVEVSNKNRRLGVRADQVKVDVRVCSLERMFFPHEIDTEHALHKEAAVARLHRQPCSLIRIHHDRRRG